MWEARWAAGGAARAGWLLIPMGGLRVKRPKVAKGFEISGVARCEEAGVGSRCRVDLCSDCRDWYGYKSGLKAREWNSARGHWIMTSG